MTVKKLEREARFLGMDLKAHRIAFEGMHKGRNLHRLRHTGGYTSPPIAALWAQHLKTAMLILELNHRQKLKNEGEENGKTATA